MGMALYRYGMASSDYAAYSRSELIDRIQELESVTSQYDRRSVLKAAIGIATAGAAGYYMTGKAEAAPAGTFPADTEDPLLKIRADRVRLIGRTSDPVVDNGTMWYRSDL